MAPRADWVLMGVTVLWASTFIFTKHVVRDVPPFAYLALRFGLAAVILVVLQHRKFDSHAFNRRTLRDGLILGMLNTVGLILQVFGLAYTTVSHCSFLTSLSTPLVPLVGFALYKTRPSRAHVAAIALATFGLLLLTYPKGESTFNLGDLLTCGCALVYAVTIVELARRTRDQDPWMLAMIQICVAAVIFAFLRGACQLVIGGWHGRDLPQLLQLESRAFSPNAATLFEITYLAIVCTVVTFAGQTWAMSRLNATHAAIIFSMEPLMATGIALGINGASEWPGTRGAIGAMFVLAAMGVSVLRVGALDSLRCDR